ncbi:YihY/virulence factor BrkB family protein [Halopseudomonas pelagia]|uniref:Ribonuclease BN n=1 Tax=Halopseudomonas pelagia TaxID=553151 RepID=A0AA91U059_9GAMM|nr:YihY/virulence factor BrkB family protein [Halopseudomonas pelagia]PCC98199.1 ribonuclease BN [Halopseudomonas pelagia]QFY57164.1 YihY/virulence factor BrkB family protein [Halopseudomonas pelagia]
MSYLDLRGVSKWTLIKRSFREFDNNDMSTYAAALAFRALLSLFPFLLFLTATLSFFNLPEFFNWLRQQAAVAFPGMVMEMVDPVIDQLQKDNNSILSISIVMALWVSSTGMRSLMNAMNNAYGVQESRPAWKLFPLSIGFTLGMALLLMVAAGFMVIGPTAAEWLANQVGMKDLWVLFWSWLRWPIVVFILMFVVAMIYYLTPDVEQEFRFITPGSVIAVMVWIAASIGFGIFARNFGNFQLFYGGIGAVIILLLYFYISASVMLYGAQLNAVVEHASAEGKEQGEKIIDED